MSEKRTFKLVLTDGVLTRNVDATRHYFVKHRAYAFDESALEKYRGQWHTLVITTNAGKKYEVSESDFYAKSYLNRDYGKLQRLVNVADMKVKEAKSKMLRISQAIYEELKAEAERTRQPMSTLIEVRKTAPQ
jgi:hypothetical protein